MHMFQAQVFLYLIYTFTDSNNGYRRNTVYKKIVTLKTTIFSPDRSNNHISFYFDYRM